MFNINNIIEHLKCVDWGNEGLVENTKEIKCSKCGRQYLLNNNIFSMLPNEINKIKENEIIARDQSSLKYNSKVSKNYTSLLDTYCLYNKVNIIDIVLDLRCGQEGQQ